eukprot:957801-Heterocapsa_arctica.AAC.1
MRSWRFPHKGVRWETTFGTTFETTLGNHTETTLGTGYRVVQGTGWHRVAHSRVTNARNWVERPQVM